MLAALALKGHETSSCKVVQEELGKSRYRSAHAIDWATRWRLCTEPMKKGTEGELCTVTPDASGMLFAHVGSPSFPSAGGTWGRVLACGFAALLSHPEIAFCLHFGDIPPFRVFIALFSCICSSTYLEGLAHNRPYFRQSPEPAATNYLWLLFRAPSPESKRLSGDLSSGQMSRAKSNALLGLVESEDEDTSEILESVVKGKKGQNMPPAKRGRAAAAEKAAKPAQTTASGKAAAATYAPGRKALVEKTTNAQSEHVQGRGRKRPAAEDAEDESTIDAEPKPKGTRGRPRIAKAAKLAEAPEEPPITGESEQPVAQPAKRGRKPKAQVATPPAEIEIPETQQVPSIDPTEPEFEIAETQPAGVFDPLDDSIEHEQVEDLPSYTRVGISSVQRVPQYMIPSSALRTQHLVPMSTSRLQRHVVPFSANRHPTAASDTEANDPSLRRRIGDLTRRYEKLEVKYRDLREIGVKEAEQNYDRLKKQGEERANSKSCFGQLTSSRMAN